MMLLNDKENLMPHIFSEVQSMKIYSKCSSFFEEVHGHKAKPGCDIQYLSYVIIPEVEINLFRIINNHSSNDQAESYMVDTFTDYISDDSTFDL